MIKLALLSKKLSNQNGNSECQPKKLRDMKNLLLIIVAFMMPVILLRAAPSNDNFASRFTLTGSSLLLQVTNVGATREVNEPQHFSTPTSNSVWFTWTAPSSGGVVLAVTNTDFSVNSPVLAAYTGTALASLVRQSSNSADFSVARVVFTTVASQTYQIVFDAIPKFDSGQGIVNLALNLYPPPANDLFANSIFIPGIFFETSGSFVGASRETGEPTHGDATLGQTLWWVWTAPTNGPNPLPMRLMADAVSFPPGMGVYTGSSVSTLTPIPLSIRTNGMSSEATFSATPGTAYHIALAGRQSDPYSTAPLIGSYRFRLNSRVLALTITNLSATTNTDSSSPDYGSVTFGANAFLQNLSSVTTGPLRVSLSAISGLSTTAPLSARPTSSITSLGTASSPALTVGQVVLVPISGAAPAPNLADQPNAVAFGVYAELQEQQISNRWFTVDETLVAFDNWPGIGQIFGPGGGVIRLDPSYVGLSAFDPLLSVNVLGPATVTEGKSAVYTGKATYADSTAYSFTNTPWSASRFTVTTNGIFTTGSVTSNMVVSLTAPYSAGGLVYNANTNVTVLNLPPPTITSLKVQVNGTLTMSLNGVPGRSHVVEAATNLSAPAVWSPLITNAADGSGILTVTNLSTTSFPWRFYRAREFP
jgi:hypothetical protein